jgi:CO/xanthine dehydrogenase Mo-binding subunit
VGRSLNPALDIGQVQGAFMQGMGWRTIEELVWHAKSDRLLTHAPSTYKSTTANDCPPMLNVRLFDNTNVEDSIHRSKAVSDPRCGVVGGPTQRRPAAARAGYVRGDPGGGAAGWLKRLTVRHTMPVT